MCYVCYSRFGRCQKSIVQYKETGCTVHVQYITEQYSYRKYVVHILVVVHTHEVDVASRSQHCFLPIARAPIAAQHHRRVAIGTQRAAFLFGRRDWDARRTAGGAVRKSQRGHPELRRGDSDPRRKAPVRERTDRPSASGLLFRISASRGPDGSDEALVPNAVAVEPLELKRRKETECSALVECEDLKVDRRCPSRINRSLKNRRKGER